MPNATFTPGWKKYEIDLHNPDPKLQQEASDKFTQAREHEIKTDARARKWEESRKERAAKDKPAWVKERIKKENVMADIEGFKTELKKAGSFDSGMKPAPGFILVRLEKKEKVTEGGIYLAEEANTGMDNIGWVMDVGDEMIVGETKSILPPCKEGDKVLFKKGAGLEMKIQEEDCRFMLFSDVLATFYDSTS